MSSTATVTDMAVKPETITFALTATQIPDGVDANNQPKYKTELKAISRDKEITAAKAAGTILIEQTFSFDKVGTVAGVLSVIKDEEEAVNIFNAGLKIKLNSKVKTLLEDVDEEGNPTFSAVEGTFDIRDLLNEPAQRRNLSLTDKAIRVLMSLGMTREQALGLLPSITQAASSNSAPAVSEAATA